MMKEKIRRLIDQILHVFFVFFGIRILFDYFWEGTVNIPEILLNSVFFSVVYVPIISRSDRKQKTKNAENNADKTE
jgi:hypothetical protein